MISPFGTKALVVNTVKRGPGQMLGMGLDLTGVLDSVTGGQVTQVKSQLDTLEILLKVAIGASIASGTLALVALFGGGRR